MPSVRRAVPHAPVSLSEQPGTDLRAREKGENFPVALRVLPKAIRSDLHAVYAVARSIDELGDASSGDRLAQLAALRGDLETTWRTGEAHHPALQALVPTIKAHDLPADPFHALIDANVMDQRVSTYATYDELLGYCELSAVPIGRIVLAVFDQTTVTNAALSDEVCIALQLLEHWQDVAEDRAAGRRYLPGVDMDAFGVADDDLDAPVASDALRRLMTFEIDRADDLLRSGAALVGRLHGWGRLAVAGYVAGGSATVAALRRSGGDVLSQRTDPRRRDVVRSLVTALKPAALRPESAPPEPPTPGAAPPTAGTSRA